MSGAAPREAAMDRAAAAKAIEDLLRALGRDPAREPDLAGTPERVAAAWIDELLDGYAVDPVRLLRDESSDAPSGRGLAQSMPVDGRRCTLSTNNDHRTIGKPDQMSAVSAA